jgi:RNA polymerase sigma-70 factor (ECF subfamily)
MAVPSSEAPARPPGNNDLPDINTLKHRVSASDRAAFEQLFRQLSPRIFRFVRGMLSSDAAAYDITQDTFAKLWDIRTTLDEVDTLEPYLFQMARHRVYNRKRDERTRRDNEALLADALHPDSSASPESELDAELLRDLFDRWIGELPARQREALTLQRMQNMSHAAIAEVMDIAPSTVNNHIVRALERLRNRLREHRPDLLP